MSRYRHRIINKVSKPIPVQFAIRQCSWDPCGETEWVKFANGTPVRTNHIIRDYRASACLLHLQFQVMDFGNNILIACDDIKFDCMSEKTKKPTENKIQTCLKRMQAGKCPYKISGYLFTNITPKKHR
ncbi:MAG: hypothetical protein J6Y07_02170 [Alphaproteobacteria bacterium]|nr:hypothetical protein [Alphaproteobacteria bacterium]